MITRKNLVVLCVGVFTLMLLTAGASAFMTRHMVTEDKGDVQRLSEEKPKADKITWNEPRQEAQPQVAQPAKPACNDSNIVGTGLGAVAGGLIGSQIGKGKGQDLATIGGAVAGGFAGHEYIPTHNTLCP